MAESVTRSACGMKKTLSRIHLSASMLKISSSTNKIFLLITGDNSNSCYNIYKLSYTGVIEVRKASRYLKF